MECGNESIKGSHLPLFNSEDVMGPGTVQLVSAEAAYELALTAQTLPIAVLEMRAKQKASCP